MIAFSRLPEEHRTEEVQQGLAGLAFARASGDALVPWLARLDAADHARLCADLVLVLSEPALTGEPLDWREVEDILTEYADHAGWRGELLAPPSPDAVAPYRVELRPDDLRELARASGAVQQAAQALLVEFLPYHPTAGARLERGRLKKLANRDLWQVELPGGYRLRYLVDEREQVVYVVYLGPHPDGPADGREAAIRALIQRQRHERGVSSVVGD
jgi:hypothetical protein